MMTKMTSTRLAVLMAATIIAAVSISAAAPLVAEAQIAIRENGVGLVDQSNVEPTIVQVQNQEACTNVSGEQSNDCEVDQTQTQSSVLRTRHDTVKNNINNIR
jgi:hypothetical protein